MDWIDHQGMLYNLNNYTQICCGDENEIVLSTEVHSNDWKDENKNASLIFKSKEARDLAFDMIKTHLNALLVSSNAIGCCE